MHAIFYFKRVKVAIYVQVEIPHKNVNNNRNNNNNRIGDAIACELQNKNQHTHTHMCTNSYEWWRKNFTTAKISHRLKTAAATTAETIEFLCERLFLRYRHLKDTRILSTWLKPLFSFTFSVYSLSPFFSLYIFLYMQKRVRVLVCLSIPISLNLIIIRLNWLVVAIFLLPVHFSPFSVLRFIIWKWFTDYSK